MSDRSTGVKPTAQWVDFHCHLDLYPDLRAIAAETEQTAIHTLAVTTVPRAWLHEREILAGLKFVRLALGLHPELAAEHAAEISLWERHIGETRYVGEVGLDGRPRSRNSLPQQRAIFQRILAVSAEHGGKVLTVHSAGAAGAAVKMIVDHFPPDRGRVVLHWFTGSRATMTIAANHGCYFSVNGAMLKSESGRRLLTTIPRDRLLTETDGPFTQQSGRPARPSDIPQIVAQLAQFLGMPCDELGRRIRQFQIAAELTAGATFRMGRPCARELILEGRPRRRRSTRFWPPARAVSAKLLAGASLHVPIG